MSKRRPPLRAGRGLFAPVIVLIAAVTLFTLSSQSHRAAELRGENSRLLRQRQYETDRLLHLQSLWQQRTSRREIVPRAIAELGMVERVVEGKEIIALEMRSAEPNERRPFGERIRAGVDRYGRVGTALADEVGREDGQ
ncbi:MAG TPA: hypothetical protein VGB13_04000 [Candidatus Krumholzibacteria bacterium]|jgi:hypothetical protein